MDFKKIDFVMDCELGALRLPTQIRIEAVAFRCAVQIILGMTRMRYCSTRTAREELVVPLRAGQRSAAAVHDLLSRDGAVLDQQDQVTLSGQKYDAI